MPTKFEKTKFVGTFVIALSLIAPPASAASVTRPPALSGGLHVSMIADLAGGEVIEIDHRRGHDARHGRDRRAERRQDRRWDRWQDRRHAERRDQRRVKSGYRGSPVHRQGYRRDNDGWWYPLAAFALGAVILNQHNQTRTYSQTYTPTYHTWNHIPAANLRAHDDWCARNYRSYSRANKTFQPYNGARKYCNSPYDLL